jgi:hypothetical protein
MDFPLMTVAPIVNREMRGGGWDPGELAAFVESLIDQYPIDRDRVYLSGFSAGGFATVATVVRRPDLFAAYAPLCGSGDPAWAPALAPVPAYLYHGDADPTVSCYGSVRFFHALEAAGGKPSMRVYKGMGHQVWAETYRDVEFYQRLLGHRRVPLVGMPIPIVDETDGNRLEFYDAPPVSERLVCWIDQPLTLADLWGRTNSLRQLQRNLELLYPSVSLAGNVLLHCPDGWNSATSPVSVGFAVEGKPTVPDGFVVRPLQTTDGMAATYRGEFAIDELARAAHRFQLLRTAEGDSSNSGLVVELVGSGRRGGGSSRVMLRASAR